MGQPARHRRASPNVESAEDVPAYDPVAIERAYAVHRARRLARMRRKRARRYARLRFLAIILVLLALGVYLGLTAWREIQRLFGL